MNYSITGQRLLSWPVLFLSVLLFSSCNKNEVSSDREAQKSAIAMQTSEGFLVLQKEEQLKERYHVYLTEHFVKAAERRSEILSEVSIAGLRLTQMDIMEGEQMSYLTFNADYGDNHLKAAFPVYKDKKGVYLYGSPIEAGIDFRKVAMLECPCNGHTCEGSNCSECIFRKDNNDCITGCLCNRSPGVGQCDHSVSTFPPGACDPE
ncbi:MAG: hypothetical protein RLP14_00330 [Owenweeksia sp.]